MPPTREAWGVRSRLGGEEVSERRNRPAPATIRLCQPRVCRLPRRRERQGCAATNRLDDIRQAAQRVAQALPGNDHIG